MSRPSSSVPHQCPADGGASRVGKLMAKGSYGAIHGANSAKITKIATKTTPVVASGLPRATVRGNEMAGAAKAVSVGRCGSSEHPRTDSRFEYLGSFVAHLNLQTKFERHPISLRRLRLRHPKNQCELRPLFGKLPRVQPLLSPHTRRYSYQPPVAQYLWIAERQSFW